MTTNRNCLLATILILFSTPFVYMLNLYPENMNNALYWCVSFLLSFVFLYLLFLISTIFQVLLIKLCNLFPIKIISLYPFTFDGNLRFHPILLLYNPEGFHNSLFYNLAMISKEDSMFIKTVRHFLHVRKISYIAAYVFLFVITQSYTWQTAFVFLICMLATLLLSYFQSGSWYGFDYVTSKGLSYIKNYLYSVKTHSFYTSSDYAHILQHKHNESCEITLHILENYLYRCIVETSSILSSKDISIILDPSAYMDDSFHLALDSQVQGLIRLLGWTGICCQNPTYVSLAVDLLLKNQLYTENISNSTISTNISNLQMKEVEFLRNPINLCENPLQLLYYRATFSAYELLFPKR